MITRLLKTVLASVAVVLFLTNCRAQDSSGQNHNALTQLSESLQRVITKVTPAIVTVEVAGYVRSGDDGDDPDPARHDHYQVTKAHSLGSGVILDPNGYIITDEKMETSIPGIFCCGDVRHQLVRQVTNAVGDATTAALAASKYIEELEDRLAVQQIDTVKIVTRK